MSVVKLILDWSAALAWPMVVLLVALLYRKQINSLLTNISGIAERASKQPVEIAVGDKLKLVFGEYFESRSPKTVEEAKTVAAEFVAQSVPVIELLKRISLTDTQRKILSELVTPNGTKVSRSMMDLGIRYPKEELNGLFANGLIMLVGGDLVVTHDLIASFMAKELYK